MCGGIAGGTRRAEKHAVSGFVLRSPPAQQTLLYNINSKRNLKTLSSSPKNILPSPHIENVITSYHNESNQ